MFSSTGLVAPAKAVAQFGGGEIGSRPAPGRQAWGTSLRAREHRGGRRHVDARQATAELLG